MASGSGERRDARCRRRKVSEVLHPHGALSSKKRPRNRLAALSRLHVSTGEARRGHSLAAQAEAEGVERDELGAARGEAHLRLSNPVRPRCTSGARWFVTPVTSGAGLF